MGHSRYPVAGAAVAGRFAAARAAGATGFVAGARIRRRPAHRRIDRRPTGIGFGARQDRAGESRLAAAGWGNRNPPGCARIRRRQSASNACGNWLIRWHRNRFIPAHFCRTSPWRHAHRVGAPAVSGADFNKENGMTYPDLNSRPARTDSSGAGSSSLAASPHSCCCGSSCLPSKPGSVRAKRPSAR